MPQTTLSIGPGLLLDGPAGGSGGDPFMFLLPPGQRISQVSFRTGKDIDCIQIWTADANGNQTGPIQFGRNGGHANNPYILNPGEYLIGISGRAGHDDDDHIVQTVDLNTNLASPVMTYQGSGIGHEPFYFQAPEGYEVAGFIGRCGRVLDALGVAYRKRP